MAHIHTNKLTGAKVIKRVIRSASSNDDQLIEVYVGKHYISVSTIDENGTGGVSSVIEIMLDDDGKLFAMVDATPSQVGGDEESTYHYLDRGAM